MVEHWSPKPGVAGSIPASPAALFSIRKGRLMFRKIRNFIDGVIFEMKKVSWPSWEELKGSTVVVLILSLIISVFLFLVDLILTRVVNVIL